jgi:hypothetical protein
MYELILNNKKIVKDKSWHDISDETLVKYFDTNKVVRLCNLNVKSIKVSLGNLETEVEVPKDCRVYQMFRSAMTVINGKRNTEVVGLVIGLVNKDGIIIEEQYLNKLTNEVEGFKK